MSQIRQTGENWAKVVDAYCKGCQFHNLFLVISFLNHAMTTFATVCQDFSGYVESPTQILSLLNLFFVMCRSEVAKAASQTDEVESKLHGKFAFTSQIDLPSSYF
jgi:hypothetical protein